MTNESSSDVEDSYYDDGESALEAALRAARYGIRVFPVNATTKRPLPGYGWKELATEKVNHVVEDFTRASELWGDDETSVAWALGLDGFVAIDLDIPLDDYPDWVAEVVDAAAINVTRRGQHFIFRNPAGMTPGNTDTKFPTSGWGEVRGHGGYIIIAGPDRPGLNITDLDLAQPFPRPEWLEPYGGGAEAVDWSEVSVFAKNHTGNRTPRKLDGIRNAIANRDPANDGDPDKGRHQFAVWALTTVAEESAAGHYPFTEGAKLVHDWWKAATPPERHVREFRGITCWAVAKALQNVAQSAQEAAQAVKPKGVPLVGWHHEFPPPRPLIDGVLDLGTVAVLYARWGCFKSFLAIDWAMHVANGMDWAGRFVPIRRPVMFLGYEAPMSIHRRCHAWAKHHGVTPSEDHYFLAHDLPRLTDYNAMVELSEQLDELNVGFVGVDTIARGGAGADMSGHEADKVFAGLHVLAGPNRTVVGIGHAGKDARRGLRGFSSQEDQVDTIYRLDRDRDPNTQQPRGPATLTNPKAKDREPMGMMQFELGHSALLDANERVLVPRTDAPPTEVESNPTEHAENIVKSLLANDPGHRWTEAELAAAGRRPNIGVHRTHIREAINRLVEHRYLERDETEPELVRRTSEIEFLEGDAE